MKLNIKVLQAIFLISFVFTAFVLNACKDYRKSLPNGYELVRSNPDEVSIVYAKPPWSEVIPSNIDRYTVIGDLVVGHVSEPDDPFLRYDAIRGYFVLDTKNDKVHQGLAKAKWLELLKGYEITKEPTLKRSTGFDKNY